MTYIRNIRSTLFRRMFCTDVINWSETNYICLFQFVVSMCTNSLKHSLKKDKKIYCVLRTNIKFRIIIYFIVLKYYALIIY